MSNNPAKSPPDKPESDQERFLEELTKNTNIQNDLKKSVDLEGAIVEVAAKYGFHFTADQLDQALSKKWGMKLFKEISPFVTFSEAPGF